MNLHPIFVHFPIALLTLYAGLEIIRLPILTRQTWYFYTKAVLVIAGALGAVPTVITGLIVGDKLENDAVIGKVVDTHENFAFASLFVFGFLAVMYLFAWIGKNYQLGGFFSKLISFDQKVTESKLIILIALLGLIFITITGGLGGAMVYGPNADPFFKPVFELLIGK